MTTGGAAGFIGAGLSQRLLDDIEGVKVVGVDNMNDYYDVSIKEYRLAKLTQNSAFIFVKGSIADKALITSVFEQLATAR